MKIQLFIKYLFLLVILFSSATLVAQKKRFIRKDAHSLAAKSDLLSLEKALDSMRRLPCDDPRSWFYQGAIHNVPNFYQIGGQFPGHPEGCPNFMELIQDLPKGWNDCTHGGTKKVDKKRASFNFLIWHRLYIYYFEKIVRNLSGDADYATPYWNYLDTAKQHRTFPAPFRDPFSSLYTASRYPKYNGGTPMEVLLTRSVKTSKEEVKTKIDPLKKQRITTKTITTTQPVIDLLDTTELMEMNEFFKFSAKLEGGLHGLVHDAIGIGGPQEKDYPKMGYNEIFNGHTDGLMAWVASAGFDPLFWLHHGTVDLIWQSWQHKYEQKPNLDSLERYGWNYVFYDVEKGDFEEFSAAKALKKALSLNVTYDVFEDRKPGKFQPLVARNSASIDGMFGSNVVNYGAKIPIQFKLDSRDVQAKDPTLLLTIDISFEEEPGPQVAFIQQDNSEPIWIGLMTYFGASHNHGGHQMDLHHAQFTFDITQELDLSKGFDFQLIIEKAAEEDVELNLNSVILELVTF